MADDKLSQKLDTYLERSRRTIQQWLLASNQAEMQRYNGNIIYPIKHPLQLIYTYILLDPHLSSVIQQRKTRVLSEQFAFVDDQGNIHEEATALLSKKWFGTIQEGIIDSRFFGYSLLEVQELVENEIKDVKIVNRGNVIPEFFAVVKNPYNVTAASLIPLEHRNDEDYYILIDSGTLGILNQVVPQVMTKRTVQSYWSEVATIWGQPAVVLSTDDKDQIGKYVQDLSKFIQSRNIVIGTQDKFEVIANAAGDPYNIFGQLIELTNLEMSKAIVSQTSTSDEKAYVGSSEVHERIAEELGEEDRGYVTYAINDIVFPKLIALGYPLKGLTFRYLTKEKRTYQDKLDTINQLTVAGYFPEGEDIKTYLDLPYDIPTSIYLNQAAPVDNSKALALVAQRQSLKKKVRTKVK